MKRPEPARKPLAAGWAKQFRALVERTRNPRVALARLRDKADPTDLPQLFHELNRNQFFVGAVGPDIAPRRFGRLGAADRLQDIALANDLVWWGQTMCLFAPRIAIFLAQEAAFESAYLRFEVEQCLKILDDVERDHGLSLWLISRRSLLLRRGSAHQREDFIRSLLASDNHRGLMPYIVYMIGFRSDPNLTPATYIKSIEQTLSANQFSEPLQHYVRYLAFNEKPTSEGACAAVLSYGERLPLVDRYGILLDVLQYIAVGDDLADEVRRRASEAVEWLHEAIPDWKIKRLHQLGLGSEGFQALLAELRVEEADAYTEGDYRLAEQRLSDAIIAGPETVAFLPLLARTILRTGTAHLPISAELNDLVRQLASEYAFEESGDSGFGSLSREALSGAHRALTACIRSLVAGRNEDPSLCSLETQIEALNVGHLTPAHLRSLPCADIKDLVSLAASTHPESTALKLQLAILHFGERELDAELLSRLPPDRASLYAARGLRRIERIDDAIELLLEHQHAPIAPTANDARRELFDAYAFKGDLNNALRVVAQAYVGNARTHTIFQLPALLERIDKCERKPFDQISLSICYYVFNRFNSDRLLGAQADAAEEYVFSRGADLPSQLAIEFSHPDRDLLPLYLDKVCSPPVLDKFMSVDTADQVELERLEICRMLAELDPTHRQEYLEQIREITRRRIVRARFEQVERTKIYVDADGVKRQAEKSIKENYHRFLAALADASHSNQAIELMRQVENILSNVQADGVRIHFPDLPANERDQIFTSIVRELMRMLISSQEYGLEAYLSTRVRHGTMGNQLRSAFEINSILTQKDNGHYVADFSWAGNLGIYDQEASLWLAERLADFSKVIDLAIEDLVRKRVQVRTDATPDGLFVFTIYNYDELKMQSEIALDTSFDDFFDKVVDRFWTVLENSLDAVRNFISGPFLVQVVDATEQLQADISRELSKWSISPLIGAIASARTQIAVNVANVASWFTLAREVERPDYEFGIAAEVAIGSIAACHPSLGLTLHRTDDVTFECRGRSLESLVYILFTALDNAVEHCGLGDLAPSLTLDTRLANGWLYMRLVNSCEPVNDVNEANRALDDLRARLSNSHDLQSLATKEGGSGYAKIVRMLRHDLLAPFSLEFGFTTETEYEVRIGVEAKAIVR